ncbi:histone acetyltransferase type B catalytic subunit [Ipomoea triloba]|uniref:histone acetyltransferase type B catalytic subunit n=1 Tax=Ipomoea triloba TaxID=35885 RepID=UPI00125D0AA4|nr:histone acetyltransferase type B catalytic subunit [Ipomoea triloba]
MGTKNQSSSSSKSTSEPKKRRRIAFITDDGVEPMDCIEIYLVSKREEVGSPDSFLLDPIDMDHFFDEGRRKFYGYKGLKIKVWVNVISFHAYADISFESSSDGGRGITDLKSALQCIFAENLVEEKEVFLQTFSTERHYIKSVVSNAELLQHETSTEHKVFRIVGEPLGLLYCRLVPLVLLLVDGSNPIDVTDPSWEIYLLVEKCSDSQEDEHLQMLGFAAVYRFHRYPDSARMRLGQILVLPQYQRKGHGNCLVKVLNNVAIRENVYDLTVEEPEDSLQHVRTCIDVERLLAFDPIKSALESDVLRLKQENPSKRSVGDVRRFCPPASVVEDVRKTLKINKKQLLQCWEVLVYLRLDPIEKYMEGYRAIIADKVKADVIGKDSEVGGKRVVDVPTEHDQEMSFVMFKYDDGLSCRKDDEKQANVEEQLQKLVDERMKQIKLIADKVSAQP